jgi:hypothetical protein
MVTWKDNSNGVVIKDATNRNFAVLRAERAVIVHPSGPVLNGLTVDSMGKVFDEGKLIGYLTLLAGQSGGDVAAFECETGARMTINVGSTSYTYSCSQTSTGTTSTGITPNPTGTTNTGGTPSPSQSSANTERPPGIPASECLSSSHGQDGGLVLTNTCNQKVYVSWCNQAPSDVFIWHRCGRQQPRELSVDGVRFISVGEASTTLDPGERLTSSPDVRYTAWMACRATPPYTQSTAFLSDYNSNPPRGYCARSVG